MTFDCLIVIETYKWAMWYAVKWGLTAVLSVISLNLSGILYEVFFLEHNPDVPASRILLSTYDWLKK